LWRASRPAPREQFFGAHGDRSLHRLLLRRRRIAGLVIFAPSWCYADKAAFARDRARHLVDPDDRLFGWREDGRPKWAWPVAWIEAYQQPLPPGFRVGIRYARAVEILRPSAALLDMLAPGNCPAHLSAQAARGQRESIDGA